MTTVDYLSQAGVMTERAKIYIAEAEKWHGIATSTSINYGGDNCKSSGDKQKMENACVNVVYYEQKAREKAKEYYDKQQEIISQIAKLGGNKEYSKILYMFFVQDKTLVDISGEIGYCDSHTRRLYRSALKMFEKTYGRTYLNRNEQ